MLQLRLNIGNWSVFLKSGPSYTAREWAWRNWYTKLSDRSNHLRHLLCVQWQFFYSGLRILLNLCTFSGQVILAVSVKYSGINISKYIENTRSRNSCKILWASGQRPSEGPQNWRMNYTCTGILRAIWEGLKFTQSLVREISRMAKTITLSQFAKTSSRRARPIHTLPIVSLLAPNSGYFSAILKHNVRTWHGDHNYHGGPLHLQVEGGNGVNPFF